MPCLTAPETTAPETTAPETTAYPPPGTPLPDPQRCDDDLIAYTLIQIWALITGRTLRSDVAPERLSEGELIEFWADPALTRAGAR